MGGRRGLYNITDGTLIVSSSVAKYILLDYARPQFMHNNVDCCVQAVDRLHYVIGTLVQFDGFKQIVQRFVSDPAMNGNINVAECDTYECACSGCYFAGLMSYTSL